MSHFYIQIYAYNGLSEASLVFLRLPRLCPRHGFGFFLLSVNDVLPRVVAMLASPPVREGGSGNDYSES